MYHLMVRSRSHLSFPRNSRDPLVFLEVFVLVYCLEDAVYFCKFQPIFMHIFKHNCKNIKIQYFTLILLNLSNHIVI